MIEDQNFLKVVEITSTMLDVKKSKDLLQENNKHYKNDKSFQELLNLAAIEQNDSLEQNQVLPTEHNQNLLSTLPSMQSNLICINRKRM